MTKILEKDDDPIEQVKAQLSTSTDSRKELWSQLLNVHKLKDGDQFAAIFYQCVRGEGDKSLAKDHGHAKLDPAWVKALLPKACNEKWVSEPVLKALLRSRHVSGEDVAQIWPYVLKHIKDLVPVLALMVENVCALTAKVLFEIVVKAVEAGDQTLLVKALCLEGVYPLLMVGVMRTSASKIVINAILKVIIDAMELEESPSASATSASERPTIPVKVCLEWISIIVDASQAILLMDPELLRVVDKVHRGLLRNLEYTLRLGQLSSRIDLYLDIKAGKLGEEAIKCITKGRNPKRDGDHGQAKRPITDRSSKLYMVEVTDNL